MTKDNYSWWKDPKNQEEVKYHSWWDHPENRDNFNLPISVINSDGGWVATCNDETEKFLGDKLHACAQGETKEEAVANMFRLIRIIHDYSEECRLDYQRWVPLRKGDWKHTGGKWLVIFGISIYFRYGKNMQGGWYVPLSKLNIMITNEWSEYRVWKINQQKEAVNEITEKY